MTLSTSFGFVTFGVLAAVLIVPLAQGCCKNVTREAFVAELESLDRIHRHLITQRILAGFRVTQVPRHARNWRRRRDLQRTSDQQQSGMIEIPMEEETQEFDVHIMGHIKTPELDDHCDTGGPLVINYKTFQGKGQLQLAELIFYGRPESVGQPLQLQLIAKRRHEVLESVETTNFVLTNDTLELSCLRHLHVSSHTVFTLTIRPAANGADWCRQYEFLRAESPALHLRLRDSNSRGRRDQPVVQPELIGDCETEWDADVLSRPGIVDAILPCCRRRVRVDFEQIGWGDWVTAPSGFDSFYCMGRCRTFGGFGHADTNGPSFYADIMNVQVRGHMEISPCCSPVHFSPLTVTVLSGPNEEMTQTLEDVVAQQCGCM